MPDPTTQSNYLQVVTQHVFFDWTIDWTEQIIFGSVLHRLIVKKDDVSEVIFDTADLDIYSVLVEDKPASFELGGKHDVMGSALHIYLPSGMKYGSLIAVLIAYKTTNACTALQWLEKEQTQGKGFPYLFSQCQAIYARSLAPLQDTPSVKMTYSAKVASTLPVLLSAIRKSPPSDGLVHDGKVIGKDQVTYVYNQPVPIPSYLIAIASGNVRYRAFPKVEGKEWTSGIWAEPELLEAAYWEFSEDTGRFLAAAEKVISHYRFGVYDLLVLPPSFPYGGMENACLTFLTPTLLTGDRTLVDVVVHELTHSWFGNGVTHAEATHFWLNEGWTTYMERVLQEILHSPAERGFSFLIGSKQLEDALNEYANKPKYQRLVIEFEKGEDPDEAYSTVPYEKGANLLLHIERTVGGLDAFLPYAKHYVETFTGQSVTTDQWKAHLFAYFLKYGKPDQIDAIRKIDFEAWLYGEGVELPVKMEYDATLAEAAYALGQRWDVSRYTDVSMLDFKANDLTDFNGNQIVIFLEKLSSYEALPSAHVCHLASVYKLCETPNAEVRLRFYQVALKLDCTAPAAKRFASEAMDWVVGVDGSGVVKGRMKFCRPVFRAVYRIDRGLAVDVFVRYKHAFHPIARKLIEKDLGLA